MQSVFGDVRYNTEPLVVSHADGYQPGGGTLIQQLLADGTAPYLGGISPSHSGGISVHFDEMTGLPVFVSSGLPNDVFVGTFSVMLSDSSLPKRHLAVYQFTVTHTY